MKATPTPVLAAPSHDPGVSLQGKRVAMVTFSSYPADPRPRRAVAAFQEEGMTVDLICLADEGERNKEVVDGLRVLRLPIQHRRGGKLSYVYNYLAFIVACATILGLRTFRRRYDLVHVHNMPDILVFSALIPKLLGAKVLLDLHDPMPELMTTIYNLKNDSMSVRIIRRLEKWSIRHANQVVTVNIACKRIFSARSCRPEKISVVMNSPDVTIFPNRAPSPRASSGTASLIVMYHGSLVERNGLDLAVAALAVVRETIPGVELRIFGPKTAFLDKVMGTAAQLGLQDCVHYFGARRLEDLVREIDNCDVGVIPNQRNAFTDINTPTRIFEYLSRGKPVIAPRTLGIQDYFTPESLFFFESGNARDLAQQLKQVVSHPGEALGVAERGQKVYLTHAWPQEKQTLVDVVKGLFAGKR
jgi:glycosyltransferase involved in cell wall biosynthesis